MDERINRSATDGSNPHATILVVGTGAVGALIASTLIQGGYDVMIRGRQGLTDWRYKINFDGEGLSFHFPRPSDDDLKRVGLAFFAVKAFDLQRALKDVVPTLPSTTVLVGATNGAIDNIICRADGRGRLTYCSYGITQVATQHYVVRSKRGQLIFGGCSESIQPTKLESRLAESGFEWSSRTVHLYRKKWLFNTVINSLCAVRNLRTNGLLLQYPEDISKAFHEAFDLGQKLWGEWSQTREELFQDMLGLIDDTATNQNSMVKDRELGRPTESRYLAGCALGFSGFPYLKELHGKLSMAFPMA